MTMAQIHILGWDRKGVAWLIARDDVMFLTSESELSIVFLHWYTCMDRLDTWCCMILPNTLLIFTCPIYCNRCTRRCASPGGWVPDSLDSLSICHVLIMSCWISLPCLIMSIGMTI